jgi:hypothetical protein
MSQTVNLIIAMVRVIQTSWILNGFQIQAIQAMKGQFWCCFTLVLLLSLPCMLNTLLFNCLISEKLAHELQ